MPRMHTRQLTETNLHLAMQLRYKVKLYSRQLHASNLLGVRLPQEITQTVSFLRAEQFKNVDKHPRS